MARVKLPRDGPPDTMPVTMPATASSPPARWCAVTPTVHLSAAERWTVGVTAHHLAGGLEAVAGIVTGIVSGGPSRGNFTRAMLDQMNAQHAKEHAGCTRTETLALFQKGAATASALVRGLHDDQLTKSGTVFTDAPPMTAEQLIMRGLLGHI